MNAKRAGTTAPRRGVAALVLVGLLLGTVLLVPGASALTISTTGVFAQTREVGGSYTVSWKTSNTLTVNTLTVNDTTLTLDAVELDFHPATGQTLTATISAWSHDRRSFTFSSATADLVTFDMTNAGLEWTLYVGETATTSCTLALCTWIIPAGATGISVRTDGGSGGGGGSEGGAGGAAPGTNTPSVPANLPSPFALFPHFSALHWGLLFVGFFLVATGLPSTRKYVPIRIPLPLPPFGLVAAGIFTLLFLYLSAAANHTAA